MRGWFLCIVNGNHEAIPVSQTVYSSNNFKTEVTRFVEDPEQVKEWINGATEDKKLRKTGSGGSDTGCDNPVST